MLKKSGQVSEFFDLDWVFIEKRSLWFWEFWLFILWFEWIINKNLEIQFIDFCKKENCLFIQIETINYKDSTLIPFLNGVPKGGGIISWYYKKFITPYTAVIDLKKSEEEILSDMKPKGRYNIKLAAKKWVEVSIVDKTDENINAYYNLMLETTSRDKFSWNTLLYYKNFLNLLGDSKLLLSKKDGVIIAGGIFIFDKEFSIYYYWASTSKKEYRNLMAPYLLQWEAIKYAKKIGSKIYDFLWVASPGEKNSPLSWVTDFKKKLTSDIRKVSSSSIYINKKTKYFIINIIRNFKK
jgi:lipid II:glycine glycyltransferase (peptidoglycan interpeptide bridge formation enzyme)